MRKVDLDKSLNDLAEEKKRSESLSSTSTEAHAKIAEDLKQEREKVAKATEDIKGRNYKEFSLRFCSVGK